VTRLKIAVVGGGHLGHIHARLLKTLEDVELVAVADPDAAAREAIAAELGVRTVSDYRTIAGDIQAAIVATPSVTHHDIGVDLLARGVDLLVEKPLAVSRAEAESLARVAARHRRLIQVGHVERFNPAIRAAWPIIDEPRYIEARRVCRHSFRSLDIGVVLDMMIHDLDLVLALVDSNVIQVQAIGATVFGKHEDMAQARLEFANGCVANLTASRISMHMQRTIGIYCPSVYVGVDMHQSQVDVVRGSKALTEGRIDLESLAPAERLQLRDRLFDSVFHHETLEVPAGNAILDEQRDFVSAITQMRAPQVTAEHGVSTLAVAERILEAIDTRAWECGLSPETTPVEISGPIRYRGRPTLGPIGGQATRRKAG
jgi:predicted dehydrogenase